MMYMLFMSWIITAVFWLSVLTALLVAGYSAERRWGRRGRIARVAGGHAWVALALVFNLGLGKELFLDEPMARAALDGRAQEVNLLLGRGASPNGGYDHTPAIVLAASNGRTDVVRVLIQHGADVNMKGDSSETALEFAESNEYREIVRMLKKAGAKE